MRVHKPNLLDYSPRGKVRLLILLFVLTFVTSILLLKSTHINPICFVFPKNQEALRVAHAGGGIDGTTYTNSIEAMNLSYSKGFRFIEVDFSATSDAKIVCVHDWAKFRTDVKKDKLNIPLSFVEFQALNEKNIKYKRCTLDSLVEWFGEHEGAFLVTDVKDNNLKILEVILNRIPNSKTVVIPQIYEPDEYDWVVAAGVDKAIWTLYKTRLNESQILDRLESMKRVIAVTMPIGLAETNLPVKILKKGFAVYAHTVNDPVEHKRLTQEKCVSDIYTDFIGPY